MRGLRCALGIAGCLALASLALSDDGYIATSGAAINYGHSKQIQMVSELVVLKLGDRESHVDATFDFKNLGGPITVTMGFPESSDRGRQSLHDFRSEVDGKRVSVQRKFLEGGGEDLNHKAVWLKKVRFGRNQTRRVHVSYRSDNGFSFTGSCWHEYVLTTGATWAKNIERCELVVDGSHLRKPREFVPRLDTYIGTANKKVNGYANALWTGKGHVQKTTLKNIKPDFNLTVEIPGGFYKFKINGRPVPFDYFSFWSSPIWPRLMKGQVWVAADYNAIGAVFGGEDEKWHDPIYGSFAYWSNPMVPGRQVKKSRDSESIELKLDNGLTAFVPIYRHVWLHEGLENQYMDMVSLSDVVKGLGGTSTFDKKSGYFLISFPRKD